MTTPLFSWRKAPKAPLPSARQPRLRHGPCLAQPAGRMRHCQRTERLSCVPTETHPAVPQQNPSGKPLNITNKDNAPSSLQQRPNRKAASVISTIPARAREPRPCAKPSNKPDQSASLKTSWNNTALQMAEHPKEPPEQHGSPNHNGSSEQNDHTQWHDLFDCPNDELVFPPPPWPITTRARNWLNQYPRLAHAITLPLRLWRILWFGRKNAQPTRTIQMPLNIEPWTGQRLPHPNEVQSATPLARITDRILWAMAHPHTRYITHAQRRKARRESLLAWQCHRLHSILRGKPSGPPRYSSSSTNPQSDSQHRP